MSVDRFRRIGLRNPEHNDLLTSLGKDIPYPILLYLKTVCNAETIVRVIKPVSKTRDTKAAGVFAGSHTCPGWNSDRRDTAFQMAIGAACYQLF